MNRLLLSAFGLLIRAILVFILIAGLVFVAFAGYKGSQPMQQDGANGMTYWQFVRERAVLLPDRSPGLNYRDPGS